MSRFLSIAGLGLSSLALVVGCSESAATDTNQEEGAATASQNGLGDLNGLNSFNGLSSYNGLSVYNGLSSYNGLNSFNGFMGSMQGRQVVSYLVKCALPAGHQIAKQDQTNTWYTYQGAIGLAPGWETGACDKNCQEAISACLMAHINTAGVHIPLWLDSPAPAIGFGQSSAYPNQEGTFFGNLFQNNPTTGKPDAFYCNGPSFATSTVPGRLGAYQQNPVYSNPFGTNAMCAGNCVAAASPYQNDGFKSCKGYNTPITVWREPAPSFGTPAAWSATATYALNTLVTYKSVTYQCTLAHTANSYWAPDVSASLWKAATGTSAIYYKICSQNSGRCLAGDPSQTGDGARVLQSGYGTTDNGKWQISSLGDAYFKICAKYSGRCLDVNGGVLADGGKILLSTYGGADYQRWAISPVGIASSGDLMGPWSASGDYQVGERVTYKGVTYDCLQTHPANSFWAPDVSPALWKVSATPVPLYMIVSKPGPKSLDVTGSSQADGALIDQMYYTGGSQQLWTITAVQ
jgi:hypothetical protein